MESIHKEIPIDIASDVAFKRFVYELNAWWPREYTWSQDALQEIKIDGRVNGLCTETGPYGFRCDWGRVKEIVEGVRIELKWQISPKREPIPDPEKASDIRIEFKAIGELSTRLEFEHLNFEKHGEGAAEYQKMMDSKQGWNYILECFQKYVQNK